MIGEVDDLDFSRYGDTLFEVTFTGHALQPGSVVPLEDASDQPWNVLACGEIRASKTLSAKFSIGCLLGFAGTHGSGGIVKSI